jgi:TPR repeat protein
MSTISDNDERRAPLVTKRAYAPPLYDPASMLELDSSIVNGFLILLGGNETAAVDDDGVINLGFMALKEGNIIDACFNVHAMYKKQSPAIKHVKNAKAALDIAADQNDDIRRLSVQAFREGFVVVLKFESKVKRLNCITRCFKYKKHYRQATTLLEEAFANLHEALTMSLATSTYGSSS